MGRLVLGSSGKLERVETPPSEVASRLGSTGRTIASGLQDFEPAGAGDTHLSGWSTHTLAEDTGYYRRQCPWTSSTNRFLSQPPRNLATTVDKYAEDHGHLYWGPRSEKLNRTLAPTGWPAAHCIEGLFDPLPHEAETAAALATAALAADKAEVEKKKKQHKAKSHVWEADDGYWVNGTIADAYLRKMKADGEPQTTAERMAASPTTGELERAMPRRGCCTVDCGSIAHSTGCMCPAFSPVLNVPLNLVDKIELNNDVRPTAKLLLAEANVGAALRRAGLSRGDIMLEAVYKPQKPALHRVRFAVREDKRLALFESGGDACEAGVERRLERTEYEVNMVMLPHLKDWCNKYRYMKITRRNEKARQTALDELLDMENGGKGDGVDDTSDGDEEAQALKEAKKTEAHVKKHHNRVKATHPDRVLVICRCGHSEVWHQKPEAEQAADCAAKQRAISSSVPALMAPGPDRLFKEIPAAEPRFEMMSEPPRRQPPARNLSEPCISGGKLQQKPGVMAMQRPAPATESPTSTSKGKRRRPAAGGGEVSPSSPTSPLAATASTINTVYS